ncbi:MAG: aldose 1-epimerase family protein [Clostridia bacterium]|nr:aldose 1-epimerase family protein [Clostridia bacterium]
MELVRGKGKGMTLLEVRNGKGLQITLSADRCMDLSRVTYKGRNMGWFSPVGYVAPAYYDDQGAGFLKSFTGGFLTTCGLTAVGSPCTDEGETLPLHGRVSNTPCEDYSYEETEDALTIRATVREASVFGHQMLLHRQVVVSKKGNTVTLLDRVENVGAKPSPCMLLYHFNMGYPLLSESAKLVIPNHSVVGRTPEAQADIARALTVEAPQADYAEQCFYYDVKEQNGMASCGIYNPEIQAGLIMSFDKKSLNKFTQWKQMGEHEYVMGLEPGNCLPDGRDAVRQRGELTLLNPNESATFKTVLTFTDIESDVTSL